MIVFFMRESGVAETEAAGERGLGRIVTVTSAHRRDTGRRTLSFRNSAFQRKGKKGDVEVSLLGYEQQLSTEQPERREGTGRALEARRTGVRLAGPSRGPGGHRARSESAAARPRSITGRGQLLARGAWAAQSGLPSILAMLGTGLGRSGLGFPGRGSHITGPPGGHTHQRLFGNAGG